MWAIIAVGTGVVFWLIYLVVYTASQPTSFS
jgi:hypothetical protein